MLFPSLSICEKYITFALQLNRIISAAIWLLKDI